MAAFLSIVTMLTILFYVFLQCLPQTKAFVPLPPSTDAAPAPAPAHPAVAGALVVFQWPMAYCKLNDGCVESIPDDRFLLHGVWPTDGQGVTITNCGGEPYSNTAARSVTNLNMYWRGLNTPDKVFREHEWNTHGSCSGQTVKEYFTNSKNLCKKYYKNLYMKIVETGLKPSNNTDMKMRGQPIPQEYYDAIYTKLNIVPIIVCGARDGKVYLLEIRLCATADLLSFQNCATRNNFKNCGQPRHSTALFYTSSRRVQAFDYISVNATSSANNA